jgi:hypothetical protein
VSYIILCRTNGPLLAITNPDGYGVAEFDTEEAAETAAGNTMACQAFAYEIIEVDL